jgi:hypothetical protein
MLEAWSPALTDDINWLLLRDKLDGRRGRRCEKGLSDGGDGIHELRRAHGSTQAIKKNCGRQALIAAILLA